MDTTRLREPFPAPDIEWRVQSAGKKGDRIWARVLAYVTSRAIMDRLDDVCGPVRWQTDFRLLGNTLSCGIGIRVGDEWVWKWDGAGHLASNDGLSEADAGKGDYSNAMKRAGYQWGIGRYLYRLDEGFATVHKDGRYYGRLPQKAGGDPFRWDPPTLPREALPPDGGDTETGTAGERVDTTTGEVAKDATPDSRTELAGHVESLEKLGLTGEPAKYLKDAAALATDGGPQERVDAAIVWAKKLFNELEAAT